ncbi:hypothetical protein SLS60_010868 [Paraconiothyrium brasiliense]|uniref:Uncharacterized protein n=1 Tax=Paraconiothyrium brasiliense TaxID=300254 RepID=A0ABR3QM77_9PLEO
MASKRKATKKTKGTTKNMKAARAPTRGKNTASQTVNGNANTPVPDHPWISLSTAARRDLNLQNYGFKNTKVPSILPVLKASRSKLPNRRTFIEPFLRLMQNKIFALREYFLPEVKDLIWYNIDKHKRTKSELLLLAEAANSNGLLAVSYRAQDCIRLILCYAALFAMEDKLVDFMNEEYHKAERAINLINRSAIWEKLRLEIADQLPGKDKATREQRAEFVLQGALRLACEDAPTEGTAGMKDDALEDSGTVYTDVEMADHESRIEAVASNSNPSDKEAAYDGN